MESLRQQIDPYLTAQPNPDQTFREYIEQLLQQSPSGFTSAFTKQRPKEEATTAQEASPTTTITEGMFRPYLDSGGGGGGESDFGVASTSSGLNSFASANDVVALDQMAKATSSASGREAIAQVVGLLTGNPVTGIVTSLVAPLALGAAGNQAWNSFNQGIDASQAAYDTAAALGGVGTISGSGGHVSSITSPDMVDAFDQDVFGITGAELAASAPSSSGMFSATVSPVAPPSVISETALGPASGGFGGGGGGGFSDSGGGFSVGDAMSGGTGYGGGGFSDSGGGFSVGDVMGGGDGYGGGGSSSSGGGGGGGGKIVCTAMNNAYGFGSFRQAVWLQYSKDNLSKAHEVGYHAMFLPLVDIAYKQGKWYSKPTRKVLEHIARHRTADLRAEMRNTKRDTLGRAYRFVLEPLCYVIGKLKGY